MKRPVIAVAVLGFAALVALSASETNSQQTPPAPMLSPAVIDTAAAERDSLMKVVLAKIAGRENAPAESVFKDIRTFKGMPAGRMLRIMNVGFGASLGVGCKHCHVVGEWEKEDRRPKQVARDMWKFMHAINDSLQRIPNLESKDPGINCTTCHRGSVKPATNL
jgi:Photosynthetic reaction centre cytochrome C subunit